jgi:drug/metabolite transporter (DMT)-like permease
MLTRFKDNPSIIGAASALLAVLFFSVNDMAIKFLSGGYPLHEVILIRSVVALLVLFLVIFPFNGGFAAARTNRFWLHMLRASFVVFSNITFFLGLSVLPLAEGVALFFVAPIVITVFSVIFLREHVPHRWLAVVIGLVGVTIMLRPGAETFRLAALFPIASAVGYAAMHMMTRYIGRTESAATMSFYIQVAFIIVASVSGFALGNGRYASDDGAILDFLLRAWVMPDAGDWALLIVTGAVISLGGYFISHAYRVAEAALVAPFEYLALPLAMIWGIVVFGEWPDAVALTGIALILASGLYLILREAVARRGGIRIGPRGRR